MKITDKIYFNYLFIYLLHCFARNITFELEYNR